MSPRKGNIAEPNAHVSVKRATSSSAGFCLQLQSSYEIASCAFITIELGEAKGQIQKGIWSVEYDVSHGSPFFFFFGFKSMHNDFDYSPVRGKYDIS